MNKLKMHSPDLVDENIKKIKELFPNCITEDRDEQGREKLSQANIKDYLDVDLDRTTIFRLLRPWVRERLIRSSRGYLPTAKLFQFLHWLKKEHPGFLDWEN